MLVLFFPGNGHWDNGMSTGTGFLAPLPWADGQGTGTTDQFIAKVGSDNYADMVTFDTGSGDWYVSKSDSHGFQGVVRWLIGMGKGS